MNIEIDNKIQREILSLREKILSNSPFAYMPHISNDCVSVVKKLGKMITEKGVTIDEKCIYCPIKDCDFNNCKFQNDKPSKEKFEGLFNEAIKDKGYQFLSDKSTAYYWYKRGMEARL